MKTLLLSYNDVDKLCDLDEIYKAVEQSFASMSSGQVVQPPILNIVEPGTHKGGDFKCCLDMGAGFYSMKSSFGGFNDNPALGLPTGMNMVYMYDAKTAAPVCIMYADHIRNLRTAAGAAIANNYLSRKDASSSFAYGAGRIGKAAFRATMRIRDIKDCYVFGWMEGENDAFIKEMQPDFPDVRFHSCATVEEGARAADIIVTVTLARKGPQIMREYLKPGTHVTAIGADGPDKQELDAKCLLGTKVVNDGIEFASKNGETFHAIQEGYLKKEDIHAEIGEIILGKKPGRESDEEITVYDTVGMGVMDLGMALAIYKKAKEQGMGQYFEFI